MQITDGERTETARDLCEGPHDFGPAEHGGRECAGCLVDERDVPGHPELFWQRIKPAAWALRDADGRVLRWIDFERVPA